MIMTYFVTSFSMPDSQSIRSEMTYIVSGGALNSKSGGVNSLTRSLAKSVSYTHLTLPTIYSV